jgi:hypothetical protein
MRKNSKEYFIQIIRTNAGKAIEFLSNAGSRNKIQEYAYDESHKLLNYYGLTSGKKYALKYLKEIAEYSEIVLNVMLTGKNQEGFLS